MRRMYSGLTADLARDALAVDRLTRGTFDDVEPLPNSATRASDMSPHPGFLDFPAHLPGGVQPRIVLFGAPHGTTYPGADPSGFAGAAAAIRAASRDDAQFLDSWDFDLGGPLFEGREPCCVDAGDLPTSAPRQWPETAS